MTDEAYDWVDDDELDLAATLGRLRALDSASVVTTPPAGEQELVGVGGTRSPLRDSSRAYLDMQERIERSTQMVVEEARTLRRRQQRLVLWTAAIMTVAVVVIVAAVLASGALEPASKITAVAAAFGIAASAAGFMTAAVRSTQTLSVTLWAEASRDVRALQSISAALLIEDSNRRDQTIENLAERLAEQAVAPPERKPGASRKRRPAIVQ